MSKPTHVWLGVYPLLGGRAGSWGGAFQVETWMTRMLTILCYLPTRILRKPSRILYVNIMGVYKGKLVKVVWEIRLCAAKSWKLTWSESSNNINFFVAWRNIQVGTFWENNNKCSLLSSLLGTLSFSLVFLFFYHDRFICQIINSLKTGNFFLS